MLITVPFELGQLIYAISQSNVRTTKDCPTCGGSNRLYRKDGTDADRCRNCNTGKVTTRTVTEWGVEARKVVRIVFEKSVTRTGEHEITHIYTTRDDIYAGSPGSYVIPNADLFAIQEEAVAECELRNNEIPQQAQVA